MSDHLRSVRLLRSPDDLDADMSPLTLLGEYLRNVFVLAAARSASSPPPGVGERAVAALVLSHAMTADLFEERWPIMRDALAAGVTPTELSTATGGLQPDELAAGLTAWADRQHTTGVLADADHSAVLALIQNRLWGAAVRPGWRRSG